jgi:hypothetical protein
MEEMWIFSGDDSDSKNCFASMGPGLAAEFSLEPGKISVTNGNENYPYENSLLIILA